MLSRAQAIAYQPALASERLYGRDIDLGIPDPQATVGLGSTDNSVDRPSLTLTTFIVPADENSMKDFIEFSFPQMLVDPFGVLSQRGEQNVISRTAPFCEAFAYPRLHDIKGQDFALLDPGYPGGEEGIMYAFSTGRGQLLSAIDSLALHLPVDISGQCGMTVLTEDISVALVMR